MKRDAGFSLIETLAALTILLLFLMAIVPAMYQAQHGNAQSAFIAASNVITNKISPEFADQRGVAYTQFLTAVGGPANINSAGPVANCEQHQQGVGAGSWDLGPVSGLGVFTDVTSSDLKGFNDPALYRVHVRGYSEDLGSLIGVRQMFEISVFYPNPTDPAGKRNCYALNIASNGRYSSGP